MRRRGGFLRLLSLAFGGFFMITLGLGAAAIWIVWDVSRDLPDTKQLAAWNPPVMTRMHAADGSLLAEYAVERRLFMPVELIPKRVIQAYISAEDKNFYSHAGLDWRGIGNAFLRFFQVQLTGNGQVIGASTITQQVAKNFLLTNERTILRKLKEALIVQRIEATFSKDQIIELYLNDIFLGFNSYGVAAASLNYFGKPLNELALEEVAYLAALPKGPVNYNPFKHYERAVERRNYVLGQMLTNGYVTAEEEAAARAKPLRVNPRPFNAQLFSAESFAEEARRELLQTYGKEKLSKGGFSVRTTLDPKLQIFARQALARGLIGFDRQRGWRGPVEHVEDMGGDWAKYLEKYKVPADQAPWRIAIVLQVSNEVATIGLQPKTADNGDMSQERDQGLIPLANLNWARSYTDGESLGPEIESATSVLKLGDVVYVAPAENKDEFHLMQLPDVGGAMVAIDPHTGRVLALVGGFSYGQSQFNRAVQAMRQPGSSFKPVVYAAALDNGYTPASVVLDGPLEIKQKNGEIWAPKNYEKNSYLGPSTLRRGIEQSRNTMTVRLADEIGITKVADLAIRLGIYDKMPGELSYALGAGETSLLKMTTAYAMMANGGKQVQSTLIDRIQDRFGKTVFRHDNRDCSACNVETYVPSLAEPNLPDERAQVMNPYTAYQITSMMEGVVQRGTGKNLLQVGRPVAGKTGTSNLEKDAWFIGYTPDLVVGVYVGYDTPKPMGDKRTGGMLAAPIVTDFMQVALADKAAIPFRVPRGIELIPINVNTGSRAVYGNVGVILEAFKPGDEPPTNAAVIGSKKNAAAAREDANGGVVLVPPSKPKAPMPLPPDQLPNNDGGLTNDGNALY